MTDERKKLIEGQIMAHLIALRDTCKNWDLLEKEQILSVSIHDDYISAFVLTDDDEFLVGISQLIVTGGE
jgi:hypothetical protein